MPLLKKKENMKRKKKVEKLFLISYLKYLI